MYLDDYDDKIGLSKISFQNTTEFFLQSITKDQICNLTITTKYLHFCNKFIQTKKIPS